MSFARLAGWGVAILVATYPAPAEGLAEIQEDYTSPAQIEEPAEEPESPGEYVGDYRITAFNYLEGDGENYGTAGGWTPVPYYTVAASEEFDLGTVLYIEGVGEVQVQDRGNFPPDRIDIHIGYDPIESWNDCYRAVYIVGE